MADNVRFLGVVLARVLILALVDYEEKACRTEKGFFSNSKRAIRPVTDGNKIIRCIPIRDSMQISKEITKVRNKGPFRESPPGKSKCHVFSTAM